jgi:hypothetical protein
MRSNAMELWSAVWTIEAASDSLITKLGIELGAPFRLKKDSNGNYPLGPGKGLPKVKSGSLSPTGKAESIYFPASLAAYDPANPAAYAPAFLDYVLTNKEALTQGDPLRLDGMVVGADGYEYRLTFYQVLHDGGKDTTDYFIAVIKDPDANGNGAGVGHPR